MTTYNRSQSLPELDLRTIVFTLAITNMLNQSEIVALLQHYQSGDE